MAKIPRVMVLSLGRGGGCSQYTLCVLRHFSLPYTLYQTKYAIEDTQANSIKIMTYKHDKLSFVIRSIVVLPFLFFKIYKQAKKYDVLFLPYFHFWNLAFIFAFKLRKKPIVLVEHDGIVHIGEEYPFQQMLINACIKYANKVIFLTDFVRKRIQPALLAHKQTYIIPHGIYAFNGLQTHTKHYVKKPNILFFGRVNAYKGIQLLIDALATLPLDSYDKLIIAGKSTIAYDTSSIAQDKLEIIDRFLSQEEIACIFNQCHILVMPYLEASQSGVAAIAIANCMPSICTDVGGLKEQFSLESSITANGGGAMKKIASQIIIQMIAQAIAMACARLFVSQIQNLSLHIYRALSMIKNSIQSLVLCVVSGQKSYHGNI